MRTLCLNHRAPPRLTAARLRFTLGIVQSIGPLADFLEGQMPAALDMLRQMVGINSFTSNREGVNKLGRFTSECFAPLGFKAEVVPSANPVYGNHRVLTRAG